MKYNLMPKLLMLVLFLAGRGIAKIEGDIAIKGGCIHPEESLYITSNGEVTEAIVRLLGLTGIRVLNDPMKIDPEWPEAKVYLSSRALEKVVLATQGKSDSSISWLGDPVKERWEDDPRKLNLSPAQARSIINICLKDLQQGEKTYPQSHPQAILFLGATLSRVRIRLAYLNELYDTEKLSPGIPAKK